MFSGIQPTGVVHIGNYLGAIRNWARLLDDYECIFCVVDYHAMTIPYEVETVQERIRQTLTVNIAAGLDPKRCRLFVQSHVPEHAELCWILSTCAPYGELTRMTQFKDKSQLHAENVNAGLFTYPVLMAADILMYKAEMVPVGDDQLQHLEFARSACRAFNTRFGETFPEPQPLLSKVPRLLGLQAKAKMSKSLNNYIALTEEPDQICAMLKTAATDPARKRRNDPGTPEICNIFTMHAAFSPEADLQWAAEGCRTAEIGCIECKMRLADHMIEELTPVRERYHQLMADPRYVDDALREATRYCTEIARETMDEVRRRVGLR